MQYIDLISNRGVSRISDIAYHIGKPVEFARKDLKNFLEFFHSIDQMQNVNIDFERDKVLVVDSDSANFKSLVCGSCGAKQPISLSEKGHNHLKGFKHMKILMCVCVILVIAMIAVIAPFIGDIVGIGEVIFFVFIGLFCLGIITQYKKDSKFYGKYVNLIAVDHITSAEVLAEAMEKPIDEVIVVLKRMVEQQYFDNVEFDMNTHELVLAVSGNDMRCYHCSALLVS